MRQANEQRWSTPLWRILLVAVLTAGLVAPAQAGSREQAKRIHDRLAGVPPSDTVLQQMEDAINPALPGTANDAAVIAMNNVNFYNVTLKNFAAPWTNRDRSVFVPLNDYIATVIGMIRDDIPFNTLLSADLTYVGNNGVVPAAPSAANNDHYAQLEANNINLRDQLTDVPQSSINSIPSSATAGIITSRAASEAFFIAGTNRAMFRFTLINHLCNDMEQMHDLKLPPDRIRQDVSRSPGGDSRLFLNNCIGCHTGTGIITGATVKTLTWVSVWRCQEADPAPSPSARSSPIAKRSPPARSKRYFVPCVCVTLKMILTVKRSIRSRPTS
jgi:hypothetical protein